jgi:uncharacterized membrane protein YuzA (DUF378 family)
MYKTSDDRMDRTYMNAFAYKLAMTLVLVGAVMWFLVGVLGWNPVRSLFGQGPLAQLIYIGIGVCGLVFLFQRDVYLPFLGEAHFPCGMVEPREPSGANTAVQVKVSPNKKVLYWATEPAMEKGQGQDATLPTWKDAYQQYQNAGVTVSNAEGVAILRVRRPQSYRVPFGKVLSPHVHYRVCETPERMHRVETVSLDSLDSSDASDASEGFEAHMVQKNSLQAADL